MTATPTRAALQAEADRLRQELAGAQADVATARHVARCLLAANRSALTAARLHAEASGAILDALGLYLTPNSPQEIR
jgi:hypothetical protein